MRSLVSAAAAVLALGVAAPSASAISDPAGCTPTIQNDPAIPTFGQVAAANGTFTTNNGQSTNTLGGFQTGTNNRHPSADLYAYQQAIADATAGNPRVRVIIKDVGDTFGGRDFKLAIVGTPDHIASLEDDAAFWRGVRAGTITKADALARIDSGDAPPAFGSVTETPHGNEPAGGEATMRLLYELASRTDCANLRRLEKLNIVIDPARNPDGRDNNTRTTAFSFDPNRDLAFQTQDVNTSQLDSLNQYPSLFFIDAHQQTSGYFFPPNEDPVLHEISDFALATIQDTIGTALQQRFNDQGLQYRNYNAYDLFANEYGDAGPSLFMGAAGMTYEKGSNEVYGKQVYDHYLAMDETVNVIAKEKEELTRGWVSQWQEAADQGAACKLQENKLVSPLHTPPSGEISQQPAYDICGYYLKAGQHTGDVARVIALLRGRDVKVYKLDAPVQLTGSHDFGETGTKAQTLPAGSFYIPAAQTMKHWLHSAMEEDPFIPYPYFYDVVNWSYPELYDLGGGGQLQSPLPAGTQLTELTGPTQLGGVSTPGAGPVLAFPTDSSKALGLVTQLLDGGATVYRGTEAFDADGAHFPTGTALVDASTLGSLNLQSLATAAQTRVVSLPSYPVSRYKLKAPKIALYTGGTTTPPNPVFSTAPANHCTSTNYCEMVFALARELNVPVSRLTPMTSTQLAAGELVSGNYTAIVNPNAAIAAGPGATALQAFVNGGGNYVSYNANGLTSARNAGITSVNTTPTNTATFNAHCADNADPVAAGSLTTPGTAFNASFDTTNPVAWGFDEGGYIYRDSSGNPVFDTGSLGTAKAAASFPTAIKAFGYQCNAVGPGQLPGRPYAIDQAFGAGHATIIGSNVFFRGWTAGPQRLVMNGVLYPTTGPEYVLPKRSASRSGVLAPKGRPLTAKQLRRHRVKARPAIVSHDPHADATVLVKAGQARVLRTAVRRAKLPRAVAERVSYRRVGRYVRMTIRGAARFARKEGRDSKLEQIWTKGDLEMRPQWAWRVIRQMTRRKVRPIAHQI